MTNNQTPSQALQKRLEILASMISMGEKIAWGSDSALMLEAAAMLAAKDAEIAALRQDALRWRRLVNASEMPFPVLTIADDPENDCVLHYGRKKLESLVDGCDEISGSAPAQDGQPS